MKIIAEINVEDIAEQLGQEQAMNMIVSIDKFQSDYDFTLRLARHLVADLKKEHEGFEPFDLSSLE